LPSSRREALGKGLGLRVIIFILSYIYYALWKQLSSYRDEPNGVVIERFRAEPVSGCKGDAALSVLPIQADPLRMAAAFCPVRLPGFGRRKYSEASKIGKTGLWQGRLNGNPTADQVFENAPDESMFF